MPQMNLPTYPVAAGRIAFGAMTNLFQTLITTGASVRKLIVTNSIDKELVLSFDAATAHIYLPMGVMLVIDFDGSMQWFGTLSVKYGNDGEPTSGAISAGVIAGG